MAQLEEILRSLGRSSKSRFEFWAGFLSHIHAETVMEIGVWKGEFAAHILAHCTAIKEYSMVDAWRNLPAWNKPWNVDDKLFDRVYRQALADTQFAEQRRKVLRGTTLEVIDRVPDQSLDFVYIDGDHTLRGIATDLTSIYAKVKPGGYVGGDDYVRSIWKHGTRFEPTLVCPFAAYFAEAVGAPFFALPFDQYLIEKRTAARAYAFIDLSEKAPPLTLREQLRWSAQLGAGLKRLLRL